MVPDVTRAALMEMVSGLYRTQMLYVMARLGIADRVAAGPRSAAELAAETGADPDALFRVLRALASLGVLTQDEDGSVRADRGERVAAAGHERLAARAAALLRRALVVERRPAGCSRP